MSKRCLLISLIFVLKIYPQALLIHRIFRPKINGIRDTQTPPPPFMGAQAQAILQNLPPDEAQALAEEAQAPAQADEVSLEVFKTVCSLFFATCFVPVFMCLVCLGSTVLFHFVRPAFNVCPFHVGFSGHFVFSYAVYPALNVLPLLCALRAIFALICCLPCF